LTIPLILASASPRRLDLLREVVPEFSVVTADEVEEAHDPELTPAALTEHNARLKAIAVSRRHPGALVLGADTLVYLGGEPLGKPSSLEAAAAMLRRLSGRTHTVCTGVCLAGPGPDALECFHDLTDVTFRPLTDATIAEYLTKVPVLDKAGAYAAQDHGELLIDRMTGSRSNVVGLPLEALAPRLARWRQPATGAAH
jgi:septum formation protein